MEKKDYIFVTFDCWDGLTNYFNGYRIERKIQREGISVKVKTYFKTVYNSYHLLKFLA